jgi:outer membrane murein-binding lipoprotein Lpp
MKKLFAVFAIGFVLLFAYGCASTEAISSRVTALEDKVGQLEQAQKAGMPSLEADVKKADDAAARAEAAARKADEAAVKAEGAATRAEAAEKAAVAAEKKGAKAFELMQKK